ncbi:MAG TPA: CapA family protein, partial [Candidatus Gracilibacteria bacterium]|nr:CapA family protein [Candidatus Gracilibacteria bacterium]
VPLLKKHYFYIVSLANNHAYDMGFQGYKDSKELLNAGGMLPFGDARGLNDDSVAKVMVRGKKIAFIGLEEVVYKIDDDAAVKKIKELKEGYLVIPFVHMGTEYVHKPISRQKELYHKLIDAGAAMVIGHHPHVVEGYEKYNGRLIFYSLGNAVFDQDWSYDTQEGLSIALMIEGGAVGNENPRVNVWLMPIRIDKSSMRLMNADERKTFFDKYAEWSDVSGQEKESVLSGMIRMGGG